MLGTLILIFVLFLAGIALPHHISVYYERRYGTVQRFYRTSAGRKFLYVMMVLAIYPGGSLPLLLMGVAVLAAYWSERRFQKPYVVLGLLCVSVALAHTGRALWSGS